jgi:hypothetical protein
MPGTTVLPNAWLIDAHLDMGSKHQKLHDLANKFGGACTKKFSQGSDDKEKGVGYWYHQRKKASGAKWGGVCKALSVYWIAMHANDADFWGWLMEGGWGQAERVNMVCDLHGAYSNRDKKLSTDAWTAQTLGRVGIIEQRSTVGGGSLKTVGVSNQKFGGNSQYAGAIFAKSIAPAYKGIGRYKQFSFHRKGGGHAVCAWVAQDVAFFDPNYGEYWFETTAGFRQWFAQFWDMTYGSRYTGEWYINSYGKKI